MSNTEKFKILLEKYKSGECTESEYNEMIVIIRQHPTLYNELQSSVDQDWFTEFSETKAKIPKIKGAWTQKYWTRVVASAAAIALLVLAMGWWSNFNNGDYLVYKTNFGETKEFVLPDGSQLTLNANSTAKWNQDWKESKIREIKLEGEAFFDVKHLDEEGGSQAIPFDVVGENVRINVLGTAFNVLTRRGNAKVFLDRGKVKLNLQDDSNTEMILQPGDQVFFDGITEEVASTVNETIQTAAAWKNGVISFRNEKLRDILVDLSDIFGKEFICEEEALLEKPMDIGVPYMNWEATKESLELSMNVSIEATGRAYKISSNK